MSVVRRLIGGAAGGAAVALLLCAIGLYAIVAFAVGQRSHEIGVRTALGADRRRIATLFLRRGLFLSVAGLAIGLVFSVLALRVLAIVQGDEADPAVWGIAVSIALLVVAISSLATWIPARRAATATVDPLTVLRAE